MANFHFFIRRIYLFWDTVFNQNDIFFKYFMFLISSDKRRKDMKYLGYQKLKYLPPRKNLENSIFQNFWNGQNAKCSQSNQIALFSFDQSGSQSWVQLKPSSQAKPTYGSCFLKEPNKLKLYNNSVSSLLIHPQQIPTNKAMDVSLIIWIKLCNLVIFPRDNVAGPSYERVSECGGP